MMAIDTRNLSGARASSAVRCITKAQHEALGTPRDEEAQAWLEKHFRRGVNVGRAWATQARNAYIAQGDDPDDIQLEAEIPWGLDWIGHADLRHTGRKHIVEVYHAAGGAFREEKALQSVFYADESGPEYTAELAVIDTTDVSDEEGFAVQPYEINVDSLRERVRDIKQRVITAVEAGAWNPADRVSDTPNHSECRSCPFAKTCHANYRPPTPDEVPGLEDSFEALRIVHSDLQHAEAKVAELKRIRDAKRDEIREYVPIGIPIVSGGTIVKRTEVAGRVSVKLGDYTKAGFEIPEELAPFVSQGQPSERWKVESA